MKLFSWFLLFSSCLLIIRAGCPTGPSSFKIGDRICLSFEVSGSDASSNTVSGSYYFDLKIDDYTITVPKLSSLGSSFSSLPFLTMTSTYIDDKGDSHTTNPIPIINEGKYVDDSTLIFTMKEGKFVSFTVDPVQNRACKDYKISYKDRAFCAKQIKDYNSKPEFTLYIAFQGTDSMKHECQSVGETFGRLDWLDLGE